MAAVVIRVSVSEEERDDAASRTGSLPQQPLPQQQQQEQQQQQQQQQQPKEQGIVAQGRDRLDSTASADIYHVATQRGAGRWSRGRRGH